MITLFGGAKYFKFVSFLLYVMEVKRLKCALLGAYTVIKKSGLRESQIRVPGLVCCLWLSHFTVPVK